MTHRSLLIAAAALVAAWGGTAQAAPFVLSTSLSPQGGWTATDRLTAYWDIQLGSPGLHSLTIEMNAAHDGSADGAWSAIHTAIPPEWTGTAHAIPVGADEGRRAIRLVATDSTGRTERHLGTVMLDRSPPQALRATVERFTSNETTFRWEQHNAGLSPTVASSGVIEVDAAVLGPGTGPWIPHPVALTDGPMRATVSTAGLSEGTHTARLVATDTAGNTGRSPLPDVVVDRVRPTLESVQVVRSPTPESPSVQIAYVARDATSGVPIGTAARVVDVDRGTTLTHATGGPGAQTIWADLPAPGTYRLAIEIVDAAGNVGRSAPFDVSTASTGLFGAASPVDPRNAQLRGGNLHLRAPGAKERVVNDSLIEYTRSIRFGERIRIAGQLRTGHGPGIAGADVEVWDARRRSLGRTVTDRHGKFALFVRPVRGGPLRVGVPVDGELIPGRSDGEVRVRLTPRVTLRASAGVAQAGGGPVVFSGSIRPSPQALGIAAKNVVFEWRDPFRGTWRPMVNTRVGPDGNVRTKWAFGAGGFTVPVRLRLPAEPGWPTEAGLSRVTSVKVK